MMSVTKPVLAAAALAIGLAACGQAPAGPAASVPSEAAAEAGESSGRYAEEKEKLYAFLDREMTGPYGIYTNRIDTGQDQPQATGHEVLSESFSLMMAVAVLEGNRERFDKQWQLAEKLLATGAGISYRYSPLHDKRYPVNAAVDDLRYMAALRDAEPVFGGGAYAEAADKADRIFYQNNVSDGWVYDFYDENYKITNKFITLCYIRLSDLRKMSIKDEEKESMLHNMQAIIEDGYLSDSFPFYESRFNYETSAYETEQVYTVESLLTVLALAEAGLERPESIAYIRERTEAGDLYGAYDRDGKPLNDIRSTAIYAIAAMIGAETGDSRLYEAAVGRMNEFRITDPASPLYGGFGNPADGQAYSFDNLMALLAYAYAGMLD